EARRHVGANVPPPLPRRPGDDAREDRGAGPGRARAHAPRDERRRAEGARDAVRFRIDGADAASLRPRAGDDPARLSTPLRLAALGSEPRPASRRAPRSTPAPTRARRASRSRKLRIARWT